MCAGCCYACQQHRPLFALDSAPQAPRLFGTRLDQGCDGVRQKCQAKAVQLPNSRLIGAFENNAARLIPNTFFFRLPFEKEKSTLIV